MQYVYLLYSNYQFYIIFKKNLIYVTSLKKPTFYNKIFSGGCQPGQYQCGDGNCVNKNQICDGKYDCVDWADERDCSKFWYLLIKNFEKKISTLLKKY